MKYYELKELVEEYSKRLDDKDKDEFWGTKRDHWESEASDFLRWAHDTMHKKAASEKRKNKLPG